MRIVSTRRFLGVLVLAAGVAACSSNGLTGIGGTPCDGPTDCPSGKVCAGGTCADPGNGRPGSACSATRDCAGGNFCEGLTGVCAMGGGLATGASCTSDGQCAPPLRCNLTGFYGTCDAGGSVDIGGTCAATADCLSGLWCGANHQCAGLKQAFPPFEGAVCADDGAFRGYFEIPRAGKPPADFYRLPFPNDIRVTAGALDISDFPRPGPTPLGVDLVKLYVDTWTADFDGFSAAAGVAFRFSDNVDYATATGDVVRVIDVTAGPTFGHEYSRGWVTNNGRTKYSCNHTLVVRNTADTPFEAGHTYAVIVTTGLKSSMGTAAAADTDFTAVMAATRPTNTGGAASPDAALGHAWDAYQPLRDWLTSKGTDAPTLATAAVFTVQNATGHMQRLATNLATQPAPMLTSLTLCGAGVTSPCDDGTPERACPAADAAFAEIHGRFSVPIYQAGTAPYDIPADGGGISETGGAPAPVRTEQVCFAVTIPKAAAMPAKGWPLVVTHHGTGGSMRSFISEGIAGKVASGTKPAAVFGFDAVEHGARKGASTKKSDDLVFNPLNPRAARDNFLQGAVDILQALRVSGVSLTAAASPTGAPIVFDPGALAFFGHSQGSTSGEIAMAWSDAAPAAIFSGAGSYLTASLLDKTMPVNISAGMAFLIGEPLDPEHPVMTIFQSFFDRSDPLSYNPLIIARPPATIASKHVYMSWGKGDTYTPRSTLEANARSLGLAPAGNLLEDFGTPAIARPVTANMTGGDSAKRTAAVFQYQPGAPPGGYDGHFVATKDATAQADWMAFLQSYLATGTPVIP